MNDTVKFSCVLDTTDPTCALGMEIWLDGQQIFNENHIKNPLDFEHTIADCDGEHDLQFVMKGKTSEHTRIDALGQIISDARLIVQDLEFNEIQLGHTITELATYTHNFNGTGSEIQDKFYGELGCNGTVNLKFTTPIYLWLLENM